MIIRGYYRVDIAVAQIDRACHIFLAGEDYFSALTLAGAGEEILGKILSKLNCPNALERNAEAFALIKEIYTGTKPSQKESITVLNKARNNAKHLAYHDKNPIQMDLEPVPMDPELEAYEMILRAIDNYYGVTSTFTEHMLDFLNAMQHKIMMYLTPFPLRSRYLIS